MCDYFSHNEIAIMNTSSKTLSLASLNVASLVSTLMATAYFVITSFLPNPRRPSAHRLTPR